LPVVFFTPFYPPQDICPTLWYLTCGITEHLDSRDGVAKNSANLSPEIVIAENL